MIISDKKHYISVCVHTEEYLIMEIQKYYHAYEKAMIYQLNSNEKENKDIQPKKVEDWKIYFEEDVFSPDHKKKEGLRVES